MDFKFFISWTLWKCCQVYESVNRLRSSFPEAMYSIQQLLTMVQRVGEEVFFSFLFRWRISFLSYFHHVNNKFVEQFWSINSWCFRLMRQESWLSFRFIFTALGLLWHIGWRLQKWLILIQHSWNGSSEHNSHGEKNSCRIWPVINRPSKNYYIQ